MLTLGLVPRQLALIDTVRHQFSLRGPVTRETFTPAHPDQFSAAQRYSVLFFNAPAPLLGTLTPDLSSGPSIVASATLEGSAKEDPRLTAPIPG